nr:uncharacterized protein LOC122270902 [Parasteatoda tepidariorum]
MLQLISIMKVKNFAKKQMMQTMLTSIPQIVKVRGFHKWMKTLVLLICLFGCSYQVWTFMQVYWTYPIIVDVFISNPKVISSPAFTLCEYNGIRKKPFCNSFPELCSPKNFKEFCSLNYQFCSDIPDEESTEKHAQTPSPILNLTPPLPRNLAGRDVVIPLSLWLSLYAFQHAKTPSPILTVTPPLPRNLTGGDVPAYLSVRSHKYHSALESMGVFFAVLISSNSTKEPDNLGYS